MAKVKVKNDMKKQFIKLLNIHGASRNEANIRGHIKNILTNMNMDKVFIDYYGNLLAEKRVGAGEGATILLSAHMDTVANVQPNREIIIDGDIITTTGESALGADDRAGIAIILQVLKNIENLNFNGTIKVAFSREEEVGCIGASQIDKEWYKDVDLAIVVDRRGSRDIVVGTCGYAFCSDAVGEFFENVAKLADMNDWKCCEGGISDAVVFSENGINSVNLSAGYFNEHTFMEYVNIKYMERTVKLILQALAVVNDFYMTFGKVTEKNRWIKEYPVYSTTKYYDDSDAFGSFWIEEKDFNGDVFVYDLEDTVIFNQGNQELVLSKRTVKNIINELKKFI